ncbi:MAG TPA: MFS transporter [Spirochaetota bacterium]|nr:MFS transporter [Spirochaetota bacterium]
MKRLSETLIKPAKFPFFYGYVIVIFTTIGTIASAPGQTLGVSAFTESLLKALQLKRVWLSLAYGIGTFSGAVFIRYTGRLFDRYGGRITAVGCSFLFGLSLIYISHTDKIAARVYTAFPFFNFKTIGFILITIAFFLIRFLGQGSLTLICRNTMMLWFVHYRGRIASLSGIFIDLVFNATPGFFNILINTFNWRQAWLYIAAGVGIGYTLLAWIFLRDKPEKYGLHPDGKTAARKNKNTTSATDSREFTVRQARQTLLFWVFAVSLALWALYNTALFFHIEDIFQTAGLNSDRTFAIFFPIAVIAMSSRLLSGFLSDYIKLQYLLIVMLLSIILSSLSVIFLSPVLKYVLIAATGTGGGIFGILIAVSFPDLFGRKHLGEISGLAVSVIVAFSAAGPFLFALSKILCHNYHLILILCILAAVICMSGGYIVRKT